MFNSFVTQSIGRYWNKGVKERRNWCELIISSLVNLSPLNVSNSEAAICFIIILQIFCSYDSDYSSVELFRIFWM